LDESPVNRLPPLPPPFLLSDSARAVLRACAINLPTSISTAIGLGYNLRTALTWLKKKKEQGRRKTEINVFVVNIEGEQQQQTEQKKEQQERTPKKKKYSHQHGFHFVHVAFAGHDRHDFFNQWPQHPQRRHTFKQRVDHGPHLNFFGVEQGGFHHEIGFKPVRNISIVPEIQ
jgi:hypothetical protein